MKKKLICLIIVVIALGNFVSCGVLRGNENESSETVQKQDTTPLALQKIPDISGLNEDEGAMILAGKGLIPKREYVYHDTVERGKIIGTEPAIGSGVEQDASVKILISMGQEIFSPGNAVGYIMNIPGVDSFSWGDNGERQTKSFDMMVCRDELLIIITLGMKSAEKLEFFRTYGYASVSEDYSETVISDVAYDSKEIDNTGNDTTFIVKVPLSELETDRPKSVYIKVEFSVGGVTETLKAGFDISW